MMKSGLFRKGKAAALVILMAGGTLWASGCSLKAVRDSLWSGVLSALEGASQDTVDTILNTFIDPS